MPPATIQELAWRATEFWASQGCAVLGPPRSDLIDPMFAAHSYFRMFGPEPLSSAQLQRVLRPELAYLDRARFAVSSLQVTAVVKGAEAQAQALVLDGLRAMGFELERRDVRFFDETRRNAVLGLEGVGWRLVIDGVEAGWLSYFQRAAGQSLDPVSLGVGFEIERLALLQQRTQVLAELRWSADSSYSDVRSEEEDEIARGFNVDRRRQDLESEVDELAKSALRSVEDRGLVHGALNQVHDAVVHAYRLGAGSGERASAWQARLGSVVDSCAQAWLEQRRRLGFPLAGDASRSGVIRRVGV